MIRHRKSGSVRVASSAENSTSSVNRRASRTPLTAASRHASRVIRSFRVRCRSEVAMNVWMRFRSAPASARAASSMSSLRQRASAAITGRRTSRETCATASASAADAMGKPASMMSTPSASRARAIVSLSGTSIVNPGACSPSRRVVSKMTMRAESMLILCVVAAGRCRSQSDNYYKKISQYYDAGMDLAALKTFLAVAHERSFSRAAAKVHRTQPAVSQAIRRLAADLGEQLFDRSSKSGTLTDAGRMLQNYGQRLVRLAEETESAMRDLRDLRRGRAGIGANEAAIHTLLPLIGRFRQRYEDIAIDVRRVPARQIAVEVQQGSLDFGALTFHPAETGLLEVPVGRDELILLVSPAHALAGRRQVTMDELATEPVVAHNDPSPARERVLRLFAARRITVKMVIALPSLDGIKRAVELKLGVALLPRRCAITEIASGRLVAVLVNGVSRKRHVTLVCRKAHRSHAADAFLATAQEKQE